MRERVTLMLLLWNVVFMQTSKIIKYSWSHTLKKKKTPAVLLLTLHSENKVSILKSKFHPEHNKYAYNEMCV